MHGLIAGDLQKMFCSFASFGGRQVCCNPASNPPCLFPAAGLLSTTLYGIMMLKEGTRDPDSVKGDLFDLQCPEPKTSKTAYLSTAWCPHNMPH